MESLSAASDAIPPEFEILEIKEKFGALRVYANSWIEAVEAAIASARQLSVATCESCGGPGVLAVHNGWWATLCDACRERTLKAGETFG
ncbi:MAG: hypothetical protein ACRD4O_07385 [Bryobacteraceae bacterium]